VFSSSLAGNWNPVFDANTGGLLGMFGTSGNTSAIFTNDGRRILIASLDGSARIWDVSRHELLTTLDGHQSMIGAIALNDDQAIVATSAWDHTVRLWDANTGEALEVIAHGGHAWDTVFLPTKLAAAIDDTIVVWDLGEGKDLTSILDLERCLNPYELASTLVKRRSPSLDCF
jgi:WD40 repeat protein